VILLQHVLTIKRRYLKRTRWNGHRSFLRLWTSEK